MLGGGKLSPREGSSGCVRHSCWTRAVSNTCWRVLILGFFFAVPVKCVAQSYEPRTVIASPFRAITDPPFVRAGESDIQDDELVVGVVVNGVARAYPINQLTGPRREIINDVLGGRAIAATW